MMNWVLLVMTEIKEDDNIEALSLVCCGVITKPGADRQCTLINMGGVESEVDLGNRLWMKLWAIMLMNLIRGIFLWW